MSATQNELIAYSVSSGLAGCGVLLHGFWAFAPGYSRAPFGAYRTAILSFLASLVVLYATTSKLVESGNFLRMDGYEYDFSWGIALAIAALLVGINVPAYLWQQVGEAYAFLACTAMSGLFFVLSGMTSKTDNVNWFWFAGGALYGVLAVLLLVFYRERTGWKALTVLVLSALLAVFLILWHALSYEQAGTLSFEQQQWGKMAAVFGILLALPVFMQLTYRDVPIELLREATPILNSDKAWQNSNN